MSNKNPIIISRSANVVRGPRIPGVFPSSRFGEQVVSTGIPSFDSYIGGGIPLGSICLLIDTFPSRYADLVLKCFVAEGAVYNHHLYVASDKVPPKEFTDELPALKKTSVPSSDAQQQQVPQSSDTNKDAHMKIAWRYGVDNQRSPGIVKGQKEAKFEFKKKTTAAELGSTNLKISCVLETLQLEPVSCDHLLREIAQAVQPFETYNFNDDNKGMSDRTPVNSLIRIAVSHCEDQILNPKFIMALRSIVRHTNSCAILTLSNSKCSLCPNSLDLIRLESLSDYVVRFEVILDDKRKTELGDVDGICEVVKMTSINSIKPNEPPKDLGFSFRNKRLTFQELHIPPEGETTAQRETSSRSAAISSNLSCGVTVKGKSIDF